MIKYAIFSDVDGTIYDLNKKIHKNLKEIIEKAKKKNIEFIICTGNPYLKSMKKLTKELDVNYFIGSNGAFILNVKTNEVILNKKIKKELAQNILEIAFENNCTANWWNEDELFISKNTNKEIKELIKQVVLINEEPNISNKIEKDINKIEFYGEKKDIDLLEKKLEELKYCFARIKDNHIEVTANNVSKGTGLKYLSNFLNIDLKNTMSIGDSANDHSMFEFSNFSYAMSNGCKRTKKKSKHHTSHVNQNGLGEAIIDFMFRNRLTDNFENQEKNLPNKNKK